LATERIVGSLQPSVQDRIAWFSRGDEEIFRAGRREVETWLWQGFRANYSRFWRDGQLSDFEELPPEYLQFIEGLTYTEKGKPNLKLVSKLAIAEALRKLNGYDMPAKFAPTTPDGAALTLEGLIAMSYAIVADMLELFDRSEVQALFRERGLNLHQARQDFARWLASGGLTTYSL
jgi:hypothetical protein